MSNKPYALFFLIFCSGPLAGEERSDVDPADLTQTVTQANVRFDSDSNLGVMGSFSGALANDSQYMGLIEATFGEGDHENAENKMGTDYLNSRAQFFHAFDTSTTVAPKAGYSLDYMHFDGGTNLLAAGGLFLVNPQWTGGMMVFPNLAYAKGTVKDLGSSNAGADTRGNIFYSIDEFNLPSKSEFDVDGLMFNLFFSKKISQQGAFVMAWPEYIDVSGDGLDVTQLTWNINVGMPLNESRTIWVNTALEYKQPDIEVNGVDVGADNRSVITFGVKRYF